MTARLALLSLAATFALTAVAAAAPPWRFFAMDTGLRGLNPRARAALLAELGYGGSDRSGTGGTAEAVAACHGRGLKLFGLYLTIDIAADDPAPGGLDKAIEALADRDAFLWLAVRSSKHRKSDPAGDALGAKVISAIAERAAKHNVRVALYPHSGFWIERVEDAVRVAAATGRDDVGATFNLCHFLNVDKPERVEEAIKAAAGKLAVVTVNGAEDGGRGWGKLIQPLGSGSFDVARVLRTLDEIDYRGPVGLQAYGIKQEPAEHLGASIAAWRKLGERVWPDRVMMVGDGTLGAFRDNTGDWTLAAQVRRHADNAKRLAWEAGTRAAVNGEKGRTRHLVTRAEHGDCRAHIEFMVPAGSNSGVYFQGRYEIQVLDSWGKEKLKHGDCGGIYQRWAKGKGFEGHPPRVNASRRPGQWQTFDVIFRAPRFDGSGKKTANARFVRVVHNGVTVHEDVEVTGPTRAAMFRDEKPTGPIMLQGDHGPVAYRNCWWIPLED